MGEQFFDDLARGLDAGTLSRRRALKLAGGALIGAVVPSLFPRDAEALNRAKRRCRRRGGTYASSGNCHCAITCSFSAEQFPCQSTPGCTCFKTVTGSGFCAGSPILQTRCSSTEGCAQDRVCVFNPGCEGSGGSCTSATVATDCPSNMGCVNGKCQITACAPACPPPP